METMQLDIPWSDLDEVPYIKLTSTMVTIASNPPAMLFSGGKASELFLMRLRASRIAVVEISATAPKRFVARCRVGGGVSGAGPDRRLRRIRLDSLCIRAILIKHRERQDFEAASKCRGMKNPCYKILYPARYLCSLTMSAHRRQLASCTAVAKWCEAMKVPYICDLSLGVN